MSKVVDFDKIVARDATVETGVVSCVGCIDQEGSEACFKLPNCINRTALEGTHKHVIWVDKICQR